MEDYSAFSAEGNHDFSAIVRRQLGENVTLGERMPGAGFGGNFRNF